MDPIADVLSAAYTDVDLRHAIAVLDKESGKKYGQRTVRTQVEHDVFTRAGAVLSQMRPLAQTLATVGGHVSKSAATYDELIQLLEKNRAKTLEYAENARFLAADERDSRQQMGLLNAYMDALYVNAHERKVLEAGPSESDDFLAVLERVKRIHSHSAAVLLAESPISGEQLMQDTSRLLDTAYSQVKLAIDAELRAENSKSGKLRTYMALLADRPLLFKAVLEEQSGVRRAELGREFSKFLSAEQPNAPAMPVRFLGSVLAWVHAAIVNEFEHISLLLDPETQHDAESATTRSLEQLLSTADTHKIIVELVDGVVSSIEQRLRQQIHAIVVSQTSAVVVDEIQSVLLFYEHMLAKYELPSLARLLDQLAQGMNDQFAHLVRGSSESWDERVDTALGILRTHDRGVYRDDALTQSRLDAVLDAALQMQIKDALPVHALNTIDLAIVRLAGYVVAQPKLDALRQKQAELELKQVTREVAELKRQSRLAELQAGSIEFREFVTNFDEFLGYANIDLQDRLEPLESPTIANRIAQRAVAEFISEYEFAIKDFGEARAADEVRTLLS